MGALCNHSLELTGVAGDPDSPIHRLDPRAKILGLLAIVVVAVSAPLADWPALAGCGAAVVAVAVAARVPVGHLWRRARIVLPLVLLVALLVPFFRDGGEVYELGPLSLHEEGLVTFGEVVAKSTIGVLATVLLGATTAFPSVLRGLDAMRVPRLFTLIASFTYRYLFVIVEEVGRMRAALAAQAWRPRNALQAGALGRVGTALFLRSHARGERVYLAMLARGYSGRMPVLEPLALRPADLAFVGVLVAALVPLRVAAGLS